MELNFGKLTSYQQEAWDFLGCELRASKTCIIKSCRQSGKSHFSLLKVLEMALTHKGTFSCILEPSVLLAKEAFDKMLKALEGTNLVRSSSGVYLQIYFKNNSRVIFRSPSQNLRGLTISGLLVLDECAYLDDEEIYTVLPFINAHKASLLICSTPFAQEGYFFNMYMMGLERPTDRIKSFDWAKNPEISRFLTEERKEQYKQSMSRTAYRTEVEGEFLTDEGLLFQNIQNCLNNKPSNPNFLYIGIDFATGTENDFTVLSAFNEKGQMTNIYRTNNLTPMQQVDWLAKIINELSQTATIHKIYAEKNSIGAVYIDALDSRLPNNITITNWITSNESKQELVTTFQIALENNSITLLDNQVLLNELVKYQAEINPKTHRISYNGKNAHDDTVIATMLAYYSYKASFGNYTFSYKKPNNKNYKSLREKYEHH